MKGGLGERPGGMACLVTGNKEASREARSARQVRQDKAPGEHTSRRRESKLCLRMEWHGSRMSLESRISSLPLYTCWIDAVPCQFGPAELMAVVQRCSGAAQQRGREVHTRKRHIVFLSCAQDVLLTCRARDQAD